MNSVINVALMLLAAAGVGIGDEPRGNMPAVFENEAGWRWVGDVVEVHTDSLISGHAWSNEAAAITLREGKDGALFGAMAHKAGSGPVHQRSELRLVAFDKDRRRHVLAGRMMVSNTDVELRMFTSDPEQWPTSQIAFVGLEELTPAGRGVVAKAAANRADEAGIELLPLAQLDKPYEFTLTTIDGKRVTSGDFPGKVVLIDCWATWCAPCMAKMPELKAHHEKHGADGLAIVGVNFDFERADAKKAIAKLGLPWPQVYVPDEDNVRALWAEAGFKSFPRLLLIDRKGILRGDVAPHELKKRIEALLAESADTLRP